MQSSTSAPEHSQALREYLAKGMSYSEIADAINSRFGSAFPAMRRSGAAGG
jgi:GcrA cell cycle regulator